MTVALEPDLEVAAVQWAKADSDINAVLAGRIATRLPLAKDPRTNAVAWASFARVAVLAASVVVIEPGPVVAGVVQWDVYAQDPSGRGPDYAAASTAIRTIKAAAQKASDVSLPNGAGMLLGFGSFEGPSRADEPDDTTLARFTLSTLLVVRA